MVYDEIAYYKQQKTDEMLRKVGLYIYVTFLKVEAVLEVLDELFKDDLCE